MKRLFIDLETCATTKESIIQDIRDNIKPPKTIKLEASKEKWFKEKAEGAILDELSKTSFSGLTGEIICIGYAVDNDIVRTIYRDVEGSEKEMLERFFNDLIHYYGNNFMPEWAGHNLCEFDLRFLFHRCVINGVKPLIDIPYNQKPWGRDVFDTLYETIGNNKTGGSLDMVAKAFGLEGKLKGFDGSMVNQAWLDGDIVKISEYCAQDVDVCRNIYKKLKFIDKIGE